MDISIIYRQTKTNIVNTVNASGLPYDMIVYALKEVLKEAEEQAEINYKNELQKEIAKMEEQARQEELRELHEEAEKKEKEMKGEQENLGEDPAAEDEEKHLPFPLPGEER